MTTTDIDLPPTQYELDQARHRQVNAQNAERELRRLRISNRKAGHPEPKPGDKMFVSLDRTVLRRSRAGLKFERNQPRREVLVIDATNDEVTDAQLKGESVVNVLGAELILDDMALNVHQAPANDQDVTELRKQRDDLEEENRLMRAELAEVKAKREARMAAKDSGDGKPVRLNAARAAAAAPATPPDDAIADGDFGGAPTAPAPALGAPSK